MALVKYNNNSISAVTSAASIPSGALVPIKTLTASSSSTLSFVHGSSDVILDSTYPIYVFKYINVHPSEDGRSLCIQANASGGSGFNESITSTIFRSFHNEADSTANLSYDTGRDQANGTGVQRLELPSGNGNDESSSGEVWLFGISSTTFLKHFMGTSSNYEDNSASMNSFVGGYFNTTSALDEFQFSMNSGNIDSGTIKLYGIKDS